MGVTWEPSAAKVSMQVECPKCEGWTQFDSWDSDYDRTGDCSHCGEELYIQDYLDRLDKSVDCGTI